MKMKKSKFILVPLLLFALILNTIPAFAASSESAAAAQDAEATGRLTQLLSLLLRQVLQKELRQSTLQHREM